LRPTQTFANTNVRYEVVCVSGMNKVTARIKTATAGGTLDIFFIGPDVDVEALVKNDTAYASIVGTIYTTGNATQGACRGNGADRDGRVQRRGLRGHRVHRRGTGTVTFCDVVRRSRRV
jgi:hypothetical protein